MTRTTNAETTSTPTAALLTADPSSPGGVTSHAEATAHMLQVAGIDVEVFYTRREVDFGGIEERPVFSTRAATLPRLPIPFAWTFSPLLFARRRMARHDLQVAVTGSCHVAFPWAATGQPFVLWMASIWADEILLQAEAGDPHFRKLAKSPIWPWLERQERFVMRRATRIIANSAHTARRLSETVPETAERIRTIYIPVDCASFTPRYELKERNPIGDYIIVAARIDDRRKNIPLVIRAFETVKQRHPGLKLVIVGGRAPTDVAQLVRALGLETDVIFPGRVDRGELICLYQGARLFCLSSLQEGMGIVLLEAMACGTPVVSTRCGGPVDILEGHPEIGRLVENDNPTALADGICELLADRATLGKMSVKCAKFVQDGYSPNAAWKELRAVLAECFPNVRIPV
jgi:glycosyltransferase involved in cell wall biosynthesis